ncbi:hypothetical protein ARAM_001107 [Aspergillus rambellii]|uniref:Xylanolytic transcriptional activator regulatory domain-containing protein n=1 Tax=Aspergillus rambellii TaxID=308745 RepID=A0A0F8ULW0_9EURO|nr:hypothetical protein ARAM_001107 [Aspergillus rambellii]
MGHDCKVDQAFQRVNRRERLEALEKEIQSLRSSVSTLPGSTASALQGASAPDDSFSPHVSSAVVDGRPSEANEAFLIPGLPSAALENTQNTPVPPLLHPQNSLDSHLTAASSTASRSLDGLHFPGSRIDMLFQIFFQYYHPYIPLLDPGVSPDSYYAASPLLFWTVTLVSSRRYADEPGLFVNLTAPVKKMLWDTISNPPQTWHAVQSILLVCLWPFPTSSLSSDITSILLSAAQTIAVRLGLHRPEAIQEFSRTKKRLSPTEIAEAARIWATCYIASQTVLTTEGQLWISSDWMIDRLCNRDDTTTIIPLALKHQLIIARFSTRVYNFMSGHPHASTGLPHPAEGMSLLALLESEYIDLCSSLSEQLSEYNKVLLHGAGLQLYVFYLLNSSGSDARKQGLLRAFHTACEVILKLNHLEVSSEAMKYGPVSYFRIISLAAMFIMKLSYSNLGAFVNIESGKCAFNAAISLTRRISIEDNDLPGRMTKILTQLWSAQARISQCDKDPGLILKNRLSASLVNDSLWAWREEFGGQRGGPSTPPSRTKPSNSSTQESMLDASQDNTDCDVLTLADVVDAEMLALLPFSLDCDGFPVS